MIQRFSLLISRGCLAILIAVPVAALYLLINIELFSSMAQKHINLPIQWQTVSNLQWYSLWLLTILYMSTGLAGLYFLRRAFIHFAKGELFNRRNSDDLRMFSIFLFVQALAKPVHFSLSSILLSINHPAGQKMLSISFGSDEIKMIALAIILWVISDLLVSASALKDENEQFI